MIKTLCKSFFALGVAVATLAGTSAKAEHFTFTSTLTSNNIPGKLALVGISEATPIDPTPFGASAGFASYQGLSSTDDLSNLDAVFSLTLTNVASNETKAFTVRVTGPVGQNSTAVSFLNNGPVFTPSDTTFTLGGTTYTLSGFRSAATPGDPRTGVFQFTVNASAVPEPASMAMLAMGGLGVLGAARRRRKV